MSRSKRKIPFIEIGYIKKKHNTISRNATIVQKFLGLTLNVHNGKTYTEVNIVEEMIGHKFGEFSFTRSKFSFKKKKSKK